MKSTSGITAILAGLALSAPWQPALAEDARVNRLLASQCAQCHGTDGRAVGDMDGLAGDGDVFEDLLDMVSEDHIEDIMEHQAHGYTPEQMRRIGAYYAGLPEHDGSEEEEEGKDE